MIKKGQIPIVTIPHKDYQPSKAELEAEVRESGFRHCAT